MNWFAENREIAFYGLLVVAIFLTRIPIAGKYFRITNTLIHEAGHAFATLLLSGEILAINLFADTSGSTVTKSKSKFSQAIIALAGYPVSSLSAWLCLFLLYQGHSLYILFFLTSISLIIMILSLKNAYGLFWAGTFAVLNLLLIYFNDAQVINLAATFFSLIIFTDSIISSLVLFGISIKQPKKAGDAANLQKITKVPAAIWASAILAFSIGIGWITVIHYFPKLNIVI